MASHPNQEYPITDACKLPLMCMFWDQVIWMNYLLGSRNLPLKPHKDSSLTSCLARLRVSHAQGPVNFSLNTIADLHMTLLLKQNRVSRSVSCWEGRQPADALSCLDPRTSNCPSSNISMSHVNSRKSQSPRWRAHKLVPSLYAC